MTSLFANQPKPQTSSLFGGSTTNPATQQSSLFGASSTNQQPSGGLFGSSQPAARPSLFASSNSQPTINQGAQQPSLFGAQPNQNQQPSLFGARPNQNQQPGLFNAQSQQSNQTYNLLGASQQQQQAQQQQPQQNNFAGTLGSGLNASTGVGSLNAQTQRELVQSRLQAAGLDASVREKTVTQQIGTLVQKWDPTNQDTLLQTYLYNSANPAFAPFYYPTPDENERDYETALAKRPEPVDGNTWVPLLVRGFKSLGERIEYQAKFVQNMQIRLHEMNNALAAIMQKHAQDLSVRVDAAKRQHAALSQRTLRLAVKCQVLRNRGYALDAQEESLRATLLELEKKVYDPVFSSREEEIWARMVVLRERARWLEEEGKRVGAAVDAQGGNEGSKVPDNVIESAKRILRDYDAQLRQLAKEMQDVQQEFNEWEESKRS